MIQTLKKSFIVLIALFLFVKCSEKRLPVLGQKQAVKNVVDGKQVIDSVEHTIGDFSFLNQDGTAITPNTFKGKVYVADFFFTSCRTICPVMKREMLRVYEAFKDNDEVLILSHTIDPEYDSVATLKKYADALGISSKKWHMVTGEKAKIYEMARKHYYVSAGEDKTSPDGLVHSGAFILVDKEKRIRGIYHGTESESIDQLITDINVLLSEYR